MCPVRAIRVAYTGELGWELHHPIEMQNYLFDRLMAAGEPLGLKLVGARAQNWLRQEKSYRAFGTELGRDATPLEAGLDRFVDLEQGLPRQGRDARDRHPVALRDAPDRRAGGRRPLGARGAVRRRPPGRAPDLGRLVGGLRQVHRHGLRRAPIGPRRARGLKVRMQNRLWDAVVTEDSPYDPQNADDSYRRIRAL